MGGGSAIAAIASKDPQMALSYLELIPAGDSRSSLVGNIAERWPASDVEAAWAWAQGLKGNEQKNAIRRLASKFKDLEPDKFVEKLDQISNNTVRKELAAGYLRSGSESDPTRQLAMVMSLPLDEAQELLRHGSWMESFAKVNPEQAAQMLTTLKIPADSSGWTATARMLAEKNVDAAYSWVTSLPPEVQNRAMGTVLATLATTDPAGALAKANLMTDSSQRQSNQMSILHQWCQQDLTDFTQAAQTMSGELRSSAFSSIIARKLGGDPAEAANFILSLQRSQREEDVKAAAGKFGELGAKWGGMDPQAATAWIKQVPNEELGQQFISGLVQEWTQSDPAAASVWIRDLPVGKGRDQAVVNLINNITSTDPSSAVVWAGQITQEPMRVQAYTSALHGLLHKDPEAGKQAVLAAPLSDEQKEQILNPRRNSSSWKYKF